MSRVLLEPSGKGRGDISPSPFEQAPDNFPFDPMTSPGGEGLRLFDRDQRQLTRYASPDPDEVVDGPCMP